MMVIKHVTKPGVHDTAGARRDVLIWDMGVSTGRVAAVDLKADGSAILAIEFDRPPVVVVPDDLCERVQACRFDTRCPFVDSCVLHEHGPDCGGCLS